jgi:geranylgeranyl diphosphate synthase type II
VLDLGISGKRLSLSSLKRIHRLKTGALLEACVRGSALICGASSSQLKALTNYAQHLGLAFQIIDDILDVTATEEELGKPARADFKKGFPYLVGVDKARKMAEEEKQKALAALRKFGKKADFLRSLLELAVQRKK